MLARRVSSLVSASLICLATTTLADPPQTRISCTGFFIYLTTGGAHSVLAQESDGTYVLSDRLGNEASASCADHNCVSTALRGGCSVPNAAIPSSMAMRCPGELGRTLMMTTGNDTGTCAMTKNRFGQTTGGRCDDGNGNSSSVDCSINSGTGGCSSTSGSGDCDWR